MLLQTLQAILDRGKKLHLPDGILINGRGPNGVSFTVEQGYLFYYFTFICYQFSLGAYAIHGLIIVSYLIYVLKSGFGLD